MTLYAHIDIYTLKQKFYNIYPFYAWYHFSILSMIPIFVICQFCPILSYSMFPFPLKSKTTILISRPLDSLMF